MATTTRDNWEPCQQGDLNRVVRSLKDRRLVRALRRDCSIAAVLFGFVLSGYVVADQWPNNDVGIGGILCYEVTFYSNAIVNDVLPSDISSCVQKHLSVCSHCRHRIESIRMHHPEGALHRPADGREVTTTTNGIYHDSVLAESSPVFSGFAR